MPKASKIPIKRGSVTVWIYHTPSGVHDGWTVVHYEPDGRRVRTYRGKLPDAEAFAEKTATRLANVNSAAANMTDLAAKEAAEAKQIVKGKSLITVATEHNDWTTRMGPTPVSKAIDYYLTHHDPNVGTAPLFSVLITDVIAAGRQDGLSDRHLDSLEDRLTKIGKEFEGPISGLSAAVMDDTLRRMQKKFKWSGRTRNHYRASLSNALHFAKRRRYLPRDWNEMEFVPKAQEDDGEIEIYLAEDLRKILDAKPDSDLLPFIVLGAFAGPRPSEICRLDWSDLHWDSNEIFVAKGKVRTAGHRVAPLLSACASWLKPIKKKKGPLTKLVDYSHPLQELLQRAQIEAVHDGLRHSFVSYRQAIVKDLGQVSSETGTDKETLTRKYCRPVKKEDAEAWFNVLRNS